MAVCRLLGVWQDERDEDSVDHEGKFDLIDEMFFGWGMCAHFVWPSFVNLCVNELILAAGVVCVSCVNVR